MDKEINQFLEAAGENFLKDFTSPTSQQSLKRENDSMDDFEHLSHDSLNQKENEVTSTTVNNEVSDLLGNNFPYVDPKEIINNLVEEGAVTTTVTSSELPANKTEGEGEFGGFTTKFDENLIENENTTVMDSNLIGKFDDFPIRNEEKEMDKYFDNKTFDSNFQSENKDLFIEKQPDVKNVTYDFMESEKGIQDSMPKKIIDFDDDTPMSTPKHEMKKEKDTKETFSSVENLLGDDFSDVTELEQAKIKNKEQQPPSPKPKKIVHEFKDENEKFHETEEIKEIKSFSTKKEEKKGISSPFGAKPDNVIEAEIFFCKMGLDTWFNPEKLNPKVESLIYWRDPKKSGPVFGGVLVILLALTYFSLISVIAYLSLFGLTATISFRVYKNVLQAVQKTGDGHPFKEFLEWDLSLPPEKVKEISEVVVAHLNAGVSALRRLFLVEDLIDSIKFGVFMWTLTYVGSWFNGMTLVILAWVALFTLPKVYETNKTQIDANLEIVKSKLADITSKVKAAIPLGKKEEKKE